jgi:hypothetical protein
MPQSVLLNAHLVGVVIYPTRTAFDVEIAPIWQLVVFAEQNLLRNESRCGQKTARRSGPTASLEPGSLVVASCSSLYFWNAGPSVACSDGSSAVSALMSLTTSESSPGGAPPTKADAISVDLDMIRGECYMNCKAIIGHV